MMGRGGEWYDRSDSEPPVQGFSLLRAAPVPPWWITNLSNHTAVTGILSSPACMQSVTLEQLPETLPRFQVDRYNCDYGCVLCCCRHL